MVNEDLDFPVIELEDSPIPGIAERYHLFHEQGLDDEQILTSLLQQEDAQELVVRAGRGVVGDWLKNVIRVLKGRQLVKDLGKIAVPITWFEFNVPYQSRASLEWGATAGDTAEFSLKLFGTGLGRGRTISWSVTHAIEKRDAPVALVRDVLVNVKVYEAPILTGGTRLEAEVSVVGRGPVRLVARKAELLKNVADLDPLRFEIDDEAAVDLTSFDGTFKQVHAYETKSETSLSVGIEGLTDVLPVDVSAEIGAKLLSKASCRVTWLFAPGFIHQPYWVRRQRGLLPLWSIRQ